MSSTKYMKLFNKFISCRESVTFYDYLDKRRDEKKARKIKEIVVPVGAKLQENYKQEPIKLEVSKSDNNGWIEWKGGECPVDGETLVEVRFSNGTEDNKEYANYWSWVYSIQSLNHNIIAYRIVKPATQPTANDPTIDHLWSERVPEGGWYFVFNGYFWTEFWINKNIQSNFTGYTHWRHQPPAPEMEE